ncbi:LEAF RUST 10 DISEASE-RESISTANCE LOCUS RECEPTOR-LIKE PROTEIN KINASE-like 2.1 isoform X1 [Pyrus x bretschneideri]|uniref:LEAF RUST 10 DISEASE-RESISTANCE LOCUS RECEPTOR-LIKE PROTEIN KINASE-like 2.1 isoform X1 n=1 Tax=Pyrus x bretschneideri TaxID=225117 RepID=UPI00203063B6|nr:LEAF RUST 10 DISEASE-RESISTANCE LOCUS RECEPTOR-LIKE PROTEIN KINASE-like 2.1 isoform X1 [Pyrus x bretschneideri]
MNLLRIIVVTIIFTTFPNRAFSADQRFEACEPQTCGNGPNISYPFWLSGKQESCGYPSFKITCNEKYPVFSISDDDYIIREIFYSNHSFVLANAAVYEDKCPLPQHNFSLDQTPFNYSSNHGNFAFFYDCPEDPPEYMLSYPIDCASNGSHHSFATFHKELVERMSYSLDSCQSSVHLPFDGDANVDALKQMNYTEILKMGFILNWTAQNCSKCKRSGGRCGFDDNEFVCFCSDRPHVKTCDDDNNSWDWKRKVIVGALSAGSGLMICVIVCCVKARKQIFKRSNNQDLEAFIRTNGPLAVKRYKFSEIRKMTQSFKDKLGRGGYGDVYKGNLLDGSPVAVKVLKASKGSGEDFINEVASISRTSHVNVVTLLGYCFEGQKKALVYEFMPNGSLEKYTYNENALQTSNPQLEVEQLLDIVTGIARGLEYLHRGCNTRILHFDIKPHNILLDENFCPKISDFGLSKLCLNKESIMSMLDVRGTIGYIAPEVFCRNFGGVSVKADVYSYGMMVLEMVGGRKNINARASHTSDACFPDWVYKQLEMGSSLGLPNGVTEEENELARKMILVGLWCIQTKPSDRPSMSRVIEMLQGSIEALQIPPKPVLTFPVRTPPESSTLSHICSFLD